MSRHLPITFGAKKEKEDDVEGRVRVPIHQILIGPGRHQRETQVAVDSLLTKAGYDMNLTETSKIPSNPFKLVFLKYLVLGRSAAGPLTLTPLVYAFPTVPSNIRQIPRGFPSCNSGGKISAGAF
jgi:hypothetical protein